MADSDYSYDTADEDSFDGIQGSLGDMSLGDMSDSSNKIDPPARGASADAWAGAARRGPKALRPAAGAPASAPTGSSDSVAPSDSDSGPARVAPVSPFSATVAAMASLSTGAPAAGAPDALWNPLGWADTAVVGLVVYLRALHRVELVALQAELYADPERLAAVPAGERPNVDTAGGELYVWRHLVYPAMEARLTASLEDRRFSNDVLASELAKVVDSLRDDRGETEEGAIIPALERDLLLADVIGWYTIRGEATAGLRFAVMIRGFRVEAFDREMRDYYGANPMAGSWHGFGTEWQALQAGRRKVRPPGQQWPERGTPLYLLDRFARTNTLPRGRGFADGGGGGLDDDDDDDDDNDDFDDEGEGEEEEGEEEEDVGSEYSDEGSPGLLEEGEEGEEGDEMAPVGGPRVHASSRVDANRRADAQRYLDAVDSELETGENPSYARMPHFREPFYRQTNKAANARCYVGLDRLRGVGTGYITDPVLVDQRTATGYTNWVERLDKYKKYEVALRAHVQSLLPRAKPVPPVKPPAGAAKTTWERYYKSVNGYAKATKFINKPKRRRDAPDDPGFPDPRLDREELSYPLPELKSIETAAEELRVAIQQMCDLLPPNPLEPGPWRTEEGELQPGVGTLRYTHLVLLLHRIDDAADALLLLTYYHAKATDRSAFNRGSGEAAGRGQRRVTTRKFPDQPYDEWSNPSVTEWKRRNDAKITRQQIPVERRKYPDYFDPNARDGAMIKRAVSKKQRAAAKAAAAAAGRAGPPDDDDNSDDEYDEGLVEDDEEVGAVGNAVGPGTDDYDVAAAAIELGSINDTPEFRTGKRNSRQRFYLALDDRDTGQVEGEGPHHNQDTLFARSHLVSDLGWRLREALGVDMISGYRATGDRSNPVVPLDVEGRPNPALNGLPRHDGTAGADYTRMLWATSFDPDAPNADELRAAAVPTMPQEFINNGGEGRDWEQQMPQQVTNVFELYNQYVQAVDDLWHLYNGEYSFPDSYHQPESGATEVPQVVQGEGVIRKQLNALRQLRDTGQADGFTPSLGSEQRPSAVSQARAAEMPGAPRGLPGSDNWQLDPQGARVERWTNLVWNEEAQRYDPALNPPAATRQQPAYDFRSEAERRELYKERKRESVTMHHRRADMRHAAGFDFAVGPSGPLSQACLDELRRRGRGAAPPTPGELLEVQLAMLARGVPFVDVDERISQQPAMRQQYDTLNADLRLLDDELRQLENVLRHDRYLRIIDWEWEDPSTANVHAYNLRTAIDRRVKELQQLAVRQREQVGEAELRRRATAGVREDYFGERVDRRANAAADAYVMLTSNRAIADASESHRTQLERRKAAAEAGRDANDADGFPAEVAAHYNAIAEASWCEDQLLEAKREENKLARARRRNQNVIAARTLIVGAGRQRRNTVLEANRGASKSAAQRERRAKGVLEKGELDRAQRRAYLTAVLLKPNERVDGWIDQYERARIAQRANRMVVPTESGAEPRRLSHLRRAAIVDLAARLTTLLSVGKPGVPVRNMPAFSALQQAQLDLLSVLDSSVWAAGAVTSPTSDFYSEYLLDEEVALRLNQAVNDADVKKKATKNYDLQEADGSLRPESDARRRESIRGGYAFYRGLAGGNLFRLDLYKLYMSGPEGREAFERLVDRLRWWEDRLGEARNAAEELRLDAEARDTRLADLDDAEVERLTEQLSGGALQVRNVASTRRSLRDVVSAARMTMRERVRATWTALLEAYKAGLLTLDRLAWEVECLANDMPMLGYAQKTLFNEFVYDVRNVYEWRERFWGPNGVYGRAEATLRDEDGARKAAGVGPFFFADDFLNGDGAPPTPGEPLLENWQALLAEYQRMDAASSSNSSKRQRVTGSSVLMSDAEDSDSDDEVGARPYARNVRLTTLLEQLEALTKKEASSFFASVRLRPPIRALESDHFPDYHKWIEAVLDAPDASASTAVAESRRFVDNVATIGGVHYTTSRARAELAAARMAAADRRQASAQLRKAEARVVELEARLARMVALDAERDEDFKLLMRLRNGERTTRREELRAWREWERIYRATNLIPTTNPGGGQTGRPWTSSATRPGVILIPTRRDAEREEALAAANYDDRYDYTLQNPVFTRAPRDPAEYLSIDRATARRGPRSSAKFYGPAVVYGETDETDQLARWRAEGRRQQRPATWRVEGSRGNADSTDDEPQRLLLGQLALQVFDVEDRETSDLEDEDFPDYNDPLVFGQARLRRRGAVVDDGEEMDEDDEEVGARGAAPEWQLAQRAAARHQAMGAGRLAGPAGTPPGVHPVGWANLGGVIQAEFTRLGQAAQLRWEPDPDEKAMLDFLADGSQPYPSVGLWRNLPPSYIQISPHGEVAELRAVCAERDNSKLTYLCDGPLQLAHRMGLVEFLFKDMPGGWEDEEDPVGFDDIYLAEEVPDEMLEIAPHFLGFVERAQASFQEAALSDGDWQYFPDRNDPEATEPDEGTVGYLVVTETGEATYADYYARERAIAERLAAEGTAAAQQQEPTPPQRTPASDSDDDDEEMGATTDALRDGGWVRGRSRADDVRRFGQ